MDTLQPVFAIAVVLSVLCGGIWILKRKGFAQSRIRMPKGSGRGRMEVIDRLVLSPQHSLHLVRLGERTLLVGLSPNDCKVLESGRDLAPSFAELAGREL